jgi:hypothetical protein
MALFNLAAFYLLLVVMPNKGLYAETIIKETANVRYILDFEQIKPKVQFKLLYGFINTLAIDEQKNIYLCEAERHRIIKLDSNGKFIRQYGRIGKDDDSLYFPKSFCLYKNRLFVLNGGGKEVKIFSVDGTFLKSFKLCENRNSKHLKPGRTEGIAVNDSYIFTDTRCSDENWSKNKFISVYSHNGEKVNEFGRSIPNINRFEYEIMNRAFLTIKNNKIYGAFHSFPGVFCYDLKGKEIFYKDLGNLDIYRELMGLDPKKDKTKNEATNGSSVYGLFFHFGLLVDAKGNSYVLYTHFKRNTALLHMLTPEGVPVKHIKLSCEGKILRVIIHAFQSSDGHFYVVGSHDKNAFKLYELEL